MCVLDVPDRFLQSIGNRQDGEIEGSDKRTTMAILCPGFT